ncbi:MULTISPECIES: hypothetical protein [unclassified Bradyrhizobium]|uniref:hypothetical protein n=1 Tax=unclassified Bradyrhizobium TaxID=2631580 RepID=UPI001FD8F2CA|nr:MULTISPECIES: hypothetical protein [unclassified Bradyrhizobium]
MIETYSPCQKLVLAKTYPVPFISHFQQGPPRASGPRPQGCARLAALGQPHYCYENIDGGHSAAANLTGYARRLALEYTYASRRLVD